MISPVCRLHWAAEIVEFLNEIFSAFDDLADRHGLEKIKTIGDAYMVVSGAARTANRPRWRWAEMALDMQRDAETTMCAPETM